MRLVEDFSALFTILIAAALLAYSTFEYRATGIIMLWLALLILAFLLLAISAELERLGKKVEELESNLKSPGE